MGLILKSKENLIESLSHNDINTLKNDIPDVIKQNINNLINLYNNIIVSNKEKITVKDFWKKDKGNLKQILIYFQQKGHTFGLSNSEINILNKIISEITIRLEDLSSNPDIDHAKQIENEIRKLYFNAIVYLKEFVDKTNNIDTNTATHALPRNEIEQENQIIHKSMRKLYHLLSSLYYLKFGVRNIAIEDYNKSLPIIELNYQMIAKKFGEDYTESIADISKDLPFLLDKNVLDLNIKISNKIKELYKSLTNIKKRSKEAEEIIYDLVTDCESLLDLIFLNVVRHLRSIKVTT